MFFCLLGVPVPGHSDEAGMTTVVVLDPPGCFTMCCTLGAAYGSVDVYPILMKRTLDLTVVM